MIIFDPDFKKGYVKAVNSIFVHFSASQWAPDIAPTSVFCWIFITMYTDYVLTLK